jgi:hypothetical protein
MSKIRSKPLKNRNSIRTKFEIKRMENENERLRAEKEFKKS